jgi:hypothetical protein
LQIGNTLPSIVVTDVLGKEVYKQTLTNSASQQLNISNQANGIYYVTVIVNAKLYKSKVAVMR